MINVGPPRGLCSDDEVVLQPPLQGQQFVQEARKKNGFSILVLWHSRFVDLLLKYLPGLG